MHTRFINFESHDGGILTVAETGRNLPFPVTRVFFIAGVPVGARRGKHCHQKTRQVLVCPSGSCVILLDDGSERKEVVLNSPQQGLFIGPMMWHEMDRFSPDCILLVLADAPYDEGDYIRDYDQFRASLRSNRQGS